MSYCTVAELTAYTGSSLTESEQQALIDLADMEIDARLAVHKLSGSGDAIKAASLHLAAALMRTRYRMDGTMPSSSSSGGVSQSDNIDAAIASERATAEALISQFISANPRGGRYHVARSR